MTRRTHLDWHLLSSNRVGLLAKRRPAFVGSRAQFESLEDRRLLSITVNTLVDEADGSIVDGDIYCAMQSRSRRLARRSISR